MCGVLGLIYASDDRVLEYDSAEILKEGLRNLRFRGPDGSGISRNELSNFKVCLAHSRLSVVDISELGSQPMSYGNFEITYNGEIYNFLELRNELKNLGYVFNGTSDTEVIIKAWDAWGVDCVNKFNGMFAFALLDKISQRLWLVRDRFGVKPLFYGLAGQNKLMFSSSASFIGEFLNSKVNLRYCSRAIRYKVFETEACESPFEEVRSVKPGSAIQIDLTSQLLCLTENTWYDLSAAVELKKKELENKSVSSIQEECLSLFTSAVKMRLRTDVPLAVSLSGGLDSSSIAAITTNDIEGLVGFSFGHPDNITTEGPTVDRFAKNKAIRANYIWPSYSEIEINEMVNQVLAAQEAPFGGLSVMAQHQVYKAVADSGFKVLLGGQGGDEVFAGYRKFFIVAIREALVEKNVNNSIEFFFSLVRLLLAEIGFMGTYVTALKRYTSSDYKNNLLNLETESFNLWGTRGGGLSSRQMEDIKKFSIPTLLRFEDRNSMGNGVESRLPFMDYRLVEFGLAISANVKIKSGYGKWILRDIMKGRVPDFIRLERKKRGFDVTRNWINEGVGNSLRDIIFSKREVLEEYLIPGIDLERSLSNKAMESNRLVLDEALMLAWLANPYQRN
tara:strand:- start:9598 stop:11451 length:1854 start_codon:yes stop_codon:yes gene_type:complete